ncbi:MAG: ATP-dependent protease [Halieaceae bacterium MED-G27]|jgi:Lon protease-like protein|nr:ATP-dependent protease [Halieaceae bacterium]OUT65656.1 MAG: ATP-dependent protease [Cellvibrionales bacterium TMED21]PDH38183.1 MAG: ATP-dependent protease [Halieaceae bacterium MED-G27]
MTTDIPLFPLGTVLLPHGRLPLQIFERRYIDMVAECMREQTGFGVVWLRQGSEVDEEGASGSLQIGDYGVLAHIVDWDQLPNGLLGITIEGSQRFHIEEAWIEESSLNVARVELEPALAPEPLPVEGASMVDVLQGLQRHPEVKRLNLSVDYEDAWSVCFALTQLLPVGSTLKYELLGQTDIMTLIDQLDQLLTELSG